MRKTRQDSNGVWTMPAWQRLDGAARAPVSSIHPLVMTCHVVLRQSKGFSKEKGATYVKAKQAIYPDGRCGSGNPGAELFAGPGRKRGPRPEFLDRKSTRLNSS